MLAVIKKNTVMEQRRINIITIIISILALLVSYGSYRISKQGIDYKIESDSFFNTPAINEKIVDSTIIQFSLNNQMQLQMLNITFPARLNKHDILLNTKPLELNIEVLEAIAELHFSKLIKGDENSVKVGEIAVPVMIDYSVIAFGGAQNLRENRLLIYELYHDGRNLNLKFKNTFLNSRYGFPIKNQFRFYNPFSGTSKEERIRKQDECDIEELLNNQLVLIEENLKKNK